MKSNLVRNDIPALLTDRATSGSLEYIAIKILLQEEEVFYTNCYNRTQTRLDLNTIQFSTGLSLTIIRLHMDSVMQAQKETRSKMG